MLGIFGENVGPLMHLFNTISGFMEDSFLCHFERSNTFCLFVLLLYILVNSYGHVRTVSSPNHFFILGKLELEVNQFLVHILSLVFDNNPS